MFENVSFFKSIIEEVDVDYGDGDSVLDDFYLKVY